ncbi:MAG: hypothetical protein OXP69_22385 [Spirochaetaceae bacterium]|nr:hypothetical protein [Spirochaetaceae bacterium]
MAARKCKALNKEEYRTVVEHGTHDARNPIGQAIYGINTKWPKERERQLPLAQTYSRPPDIVE